jgi:hypothetical protein
MTAHLSNEEISNYCERRLSRGALDHAHEHLFSCDTCYDRFLRVFQTKRRFPIEIDLNELAGLKGWHLQGQELKDYVEGRLADPDLTFANIHLKECAWCREEAHHISEFSDKLQYYLSKRHAPLEHPTVSRRYLPRLGNLSWGSLDLGKAAAIILLVLGSVIILWSVSGTKPEAKQDGLSASSRENTSVTTAASGSPQNANVLPVPQPSQSGASIQSQGASYIDNSARSSRPSTERENEASLITANLVMPEVVKMFDRSRVILRGDDNRDESFNIISPYATVITDDQPTFRWTALSGAASYTVSVYDDSLNLVERSKPINETRWSATSRLKRGVVYTWIVTAIRESKEILAPKLPARAEFKIIENTKLLNLNGKINRVHSGAARGVLYARAGLLDKAEQELLLHLNNRPDDERAKNLLQTISSWREP